MPLHLTQQSGIELMQATVGDRDPETLRFRLIRVVLTPLRNLSRHMTVKRAEWTTKPPKKPGTRPPPTAAQTKVYGLDSTNRKGTNNGTNKHRSGYKKEYLKYTWGDWIKKMTVGRAKLTKTRAVTQENAKGHRWYEQKYDERHG